MSKYNVYMLLITGGMIVATISGTPRVLLSLGLLSIVGCLLFIAENIEKLKK